MKYAGLLLGCIIVITASAQLAMPQSRTSTPLKVTTLTINARATRSDRVAKGWLSQPLVRVENVSNKTIEYLTIETTLPGVTEPFMLAYGRQPGKPADNNVQSLQPGAKIDLSVDQNACELIKKRLFEMDARSLSGNHATTKINGVMFNDQTGWFGGLPHVMEPNNPLRWNVVRSTSRASALNNSPMFSFLKVGLRANSNAEPNPTICSDILGSYYVDCCGIQQISLLMLKGSGEWIPHDVVTACCEYRDADPCF
jgi:hypothetical protein